MSTFALVHGAWGSGWHWAGVPGELRAMGHEAVAPDLPCEDAEATLEDYAQVVVDALAGAGDDVVVVGYSLGGITAPLVALRRPVRRIVYVGALLPRPRASLNDQLREEPQLLHREYLAGLERVPCGTRWTDFGVYHRTVCHELGESAARERYDRSRTQCARPFADPFPHDALPAVPARYVFCADDRLVNNAAWAPRAEALGIERVDIPGDHSPVAVRPAELARLLTA